MTEEKTPLMIAIEARQAEVDSYTANVVLYTTILKNLNGTWDADLIQFKGMDAQEAARQCSFERLERLAELQHYDQVSNLLKTETVERFKAQSILNTLQSM